MYSTKEVKQAIIKATGCNKVGTNNKSVQGEVLGVTYKVKSDRGTQVTIWECKNDIIEVSICCGGYFYFQETYKVCVKDGVIIDKPEISGNRIAKDFLKNFILN